jgi:hypothetical protein
MNDVPVYIKDLFHSKMEQSIKHYAKFVNEWPKYCFSSLIKLNKELKIP